MACPPLDKLDTISRDLWLLSQREFQYAAASFLGGLENKLEPEFITTIEYLDNFWQRSEIASPPKCTSGGPQRHYGKLIIYRP